MYIIISTLIAKERHVLVSADCGSKDEIDVLNNICKENNIEFIVYDKCKSCNNVKDDINCKPLPNKGRDANTTLYYIINNYYKLPKVMYFVPSTIYKHNRLEKLKMLLSDKNMTCKLESKLKYDADFTLNEYDGKKLLKSDIRPFKKWFTKHVGEWNDEGDICFNIIFKTTREKVLRKPKSYYINLYNQVNRVDSDETVHYVERAIYTIFS
jgi:hypothetical protein